MITQVLFIFSLFVVGLLFSLTWSKKAPMWFTLASAIFWGALNWVLISVLVTAFAGHFSFLISAAVCAVEAIGLLLFNIFRRSVRLTAKQWFTLGGYALAVIAAALLFSSFNMTTSSNDSLFLISMGRDLVASGYSLFHLAAPGSYEIFVSMLQAASGALGLDYLFALQPVFTLNFIVLIFCACWEVGKNLRYRWLKVLLPLLATVFIFSSMMMRFEFTYIHTNLLTGIYLFITVLCLLYFGQTRDELWLGLGVAALLGFSWLRTENILFALLVLGLALPLLKITYRQRMVYLLPFLTVMLVWLVGVYLMAAHTFNVILNPTVLKLVLAVLAAFILFLLLSHIGFIAEKILPIFHFILLGGMGVVFMTGFFVMHDLQIISMTSMTSQLFLSGGWGFTWAAVFALLMFLIFERGTQPRKLTQTFFLFLIPIYFLFILFLSYSRTPYESVWTDSDNRMFVQILPLVVYWVIWLLDEKLTPTKEEPLLAGK